jgi:hypothetical protein
LNKVVLPAPFGPIKPTIRPLLTVKLTTSSATMPPNRMVRCAIYSNGAAAPSCVPDAVRNDVSVMAIKQPFGLEPPQPRVVHCFCFYALSARRSHLLRRRPAGADPMG